MYTALQTAAYIANEYNEKHKQPIDEMRLHKYLYLSQRESFILFNKPLFSGIMEAWKFGPVCTDVRHSLHTNTLDTSLLPSYGSNFREVIENVISRYDTFSSWGLSRLTHNEKSWRNARVGIPDGDNSDRPISLADIRQDAAFEKEKRTREALEEVLESTDVQA